MVSPGDLYCWLCTHTALSAHSSLDPGELDTDREREHATEGRAQELRQLFIGKVKELQEANCTLPRYSGYQQCKHCASISEADKDEADRDEADEDEADKDKADKETCRFRGWRVFKSVFRATTCALRPTVLTLVTLELMERRASL